MELKGLKKLFVNKGITLGSVESFTGGLFASTVTKLSGASNFFKGALVTYATEEKEALVGVEKDTIEKYGVVSKQVGTEMALKGCKVLNTDYCVSFTGNAGPQAMEDKPVGLIYVAVSNGKKTLCKEYSLSGTRNEIQNYAICIALDMLEDFVK